MLNIINIEFKSQENKNSNYKLLLYLEGNKKQFDRKLRNVLGCKRICVIKKSFLNYWVAKGLVQLLQGESKP